LYVKKQKDVMTELAASIKADMNVKLVEVMVCVQNVVFESQTELTSKSLKNAAEAAPAVRSSTKKICSSGFFLIRVFPNRSKTKERKKERGIFQRQRRRS
jgi:hypothetical protein